MNDEQGERLVASLRASPPWDHPADDGGMIATHLSWVVLAGPYAYKIKKPVDFGFVDFTTLERRRHFLEEELRLNRRFSDGWYLSIISFYGTPDHPTLVDDGSSPFEYALKMRRFSQSALLNHITPDESLIERLADQVATFHRSPEAVAAPHDSPYGAPATVRGVVEDNFSHVNDLLPPGGLRARVEALCQREAGRFESFRGMIVDRKADRFVRELHGDLHRGNIAVIDEEPLLFDALEFNPSLRWIDTMAEIAFLVMDFKAANLPWAARLFLNRYLETTGDYDGAPLLPLYLCYRAMVRAKVALLSRPADEPDDGPCIRRFLTYLSLAESLGEPVGRPKLIITHGLSGCGKSRFTRNLIPLIDGVRIRSDRERLRFFPSREGRYDAASTKAVYKRLLDAAKRVLDAGYAAIIDGAFLSATQRYSFANFALERNIDMTILDFVDPGDEALAGRLARRDEDDPSEATEEVVAAQRLAREPLTDDERRMAITIDETTTPQEVVKRLVR